jgi:hypothetical protein
MADPENQTPPAPGPAPDTMSHIDRLAAFDFDDQPEVAPAGERPAREAAVAEPEPVELAGETAEAEPAQPNEDDVETVLRDGRKVKLAELKRGYRDDWEMREQRWAEHQKETLAFQRATAQFNQTQQQQAYLLQQAVEVVARNMPPKPTLELLNSDPLEYQRQNAIWEHKQGELRQLQYARAAQWQQATQQAAQAKQQYLAREAQTILTRYPNLKDPVKHAKFMDEARKYAVSIGYKASDLALVDNHRLVTMLTDAIDGVRLRAAAERAKAKREQIQPVPVQAPSRRRTSAEVDQERLRGDLARLKKSGRMEDSIKVLSQWD